MRLSTLLAASVFAWTAMAGGPYASATAVQDRGQNELRVAGQDAAIPHELIVVENSLPQQPDNPKANGTATASDVRLASDGAFPRASVLSPDSFQIASDLPRSPWRARAPPSQAT
jgi:hypothetical protein